MFTFLKQLLTHTYTYLQIKISFLVIRLTVEIPRVGTQSPKAYKQNHKFISNYKQFNNPWYCLHDKTIFNWDGRILYCCQIFSSSSTPMLNCANTARNSVIMEQCSQIHVQLVTDLAYILITPCIIRFSSTTD